MSKKILFIGNGGREHAMIAALARSPQKPAIYNFATAVNPGIKDLVSDIRVHSSLNDLDAIKAYAQEAEVDFAVVGPEDPLAAGVRDALLEGGVKTFGPSAQGAQLESSKSFTRNLLKKHGIDASPGFQVFESEDEVPQMQEFYEQYDGQIVVKADGLIGGKGVIVADDHFNAFDDARDFALVSINKFGRVVFEERLVGEEFSLISVVDGETVLDTPAIQDHKRAFEGDTGPNTGGMGCISDENNSLPFVTDEDKAAAHEITVQVMKALNEELGEQFVGVMYGGFMITHAGVKLIEYNVRFGDPEALNIFPILESDFVEVCEKAIEGNLSDLGTLQFAAQATVVKYLCPNGYPENPIKDEPITIDSSYKPNEHQVAYFASLGEEGDKILLKGSRGIGCVGIGKSLSEANQYCDDLITKFSGPVFHRKDIGTADLVNQRVKHMKEIRGN